MQSIVIRSERKNESRTKAKTRDKLLQAAYRIIAKQGVYNLGVAEISENAAITRQNFYNYYENTDELCCELHPLVLNQYADLIRVFAEKTEGERDAPEIKPSSGIYWRLIAMHRILDEDWELLNYLVRFDQYFSNNKQYKDSPYSLSRYLMEECGLDILVQKLVDNADHYPDPQVLNLIITESFIAFIEKMMFRKESYQQEGHIGYHNFSFFATTIVSGLSMEVNSGS